MFFRIMKLLLSTDLHMVWHKFFLNLKNAVADILWPPACILCTRYCREPVCKECKTKIHLFIGGSSFAGAQAAENSCAPACRCIYACGVYAGVYKEAVRKYKFHGQMWIGKGFAEMMFEMLSDKGVFEDCLCVTYVPISDKRFAERGFDQCEFVAHLIADKAGIPCKKMLTRKVQGAMQSKFSRNERLKNSHDRFEYDCECFGAQNCFGEKEEKRNIILVDDILTTGATIQECAELLAKNGFENIIGAVIATGRKDI